MFGHINKDCFIFICDAAFRDALLKQGLPLIYTELEEGTESFAVSLKNTLKEYKPETVLVLRPGSWRVLKAIQSVCEKAQ